MNKKVRGHEPAHLAIHCCMSTTALTLDARIVRTCIVHAMMAVKMKRTPTDQEVVGDLLNQLRLIRTRALYEGWPPVRLPAWHGKCNCFHLSNCDSAPISLAQNGSGSVLASACSFRTCAAGHVQVEDRLHVGSLARHLRAPRPDHRCDKRRTSSHALFWKPLLFSQIASVCTSGCYSMVSCCAQARCLSRMAATSANAGDT